MTLHKYINLFATTLLLLATAACGNKTTTDLEDENLHGKVKSVTERQYMAVQLFDKVVKGDPYRPEEGAWDIKKTYNKHGYMIEYLQLAIGDNDTITVTSRVFDSIVPSRKLLEITDNEKGEVIRYEVTKYNKDGKPDTIATTDPFGTLQQMVLIDYEHRGQKETKSYYSNNGNLRYKQITILDGEYPISVTNYDNEGHMIGCRRDLWKKGLRDSTAFFDEHGRCLSRIGFDYDPYGNIVNQHGTDENGDPIKVETYEYEYDEQNNWIRCVFRVEGKPYYVTERTIEYYQ